MPHCSAADARWRSPPDGPLVPVMVGVAPVVVRVVSYLR
jgi:hypothetical protein